MSSSWSPNRAGSISQGGRPRGLPSPAIRNEPLSGPVPRLGWAYSGRRGVPRSTIPWRGEPSVTTSVNKPIPVGFDALPVLDLCDPNFTTRGNGLLAELRAQGPVCRVEPLGVLGFLRWAECDAILRDFKTFSAEFARSCPVPGAEEETKIDTLLREDPPKHTRVRALMQQAFTPHARGRDGAPHAGDHSQADRRHHGRRRRVRFPPSVRPPPPLDGDVGPPGRRCLDDGDVRALGEFDDGCQHGPCNQGRSGATGALPGDRE